MPSSEVALRRFTRMLSFNPSAMRMTLQDGSFEHVQLGSGVFAGAVAHASTPGLRTDWGSYNIPVQARGDLCRDMFTLGILVAGDDSWRVFGSPARTGDMLLMREGGELLINLPPHSQWLALQVPRARLEAAGVSLDGLRGASVWRMAKTDDNGVHRQLMDLGPMLAPAETDPGLMPAPADPARADAGFELGQAHEQLLTLLLGEWERRRVALAGKFSDRLPPDERWRVVQRAEGYLRANPDPMVRIDDLCLAACTSLSTLERVFRDVFGVTPRRYLALRRLAGVRNDLLNGDPGISITAVAAHWGFFHLGRFAQEYGQLYHERPSQTLRRAGAAGKR